MWDSNGQQGVEGQGIHQDPWAPLQTGPKREHPLPQAGEGKGPGLNEGTHLVGRRAGS